MDIIAGILKESWLLFFRLGIYLVMGFIVAGIIHQFLTPKTVVRHLGKPNFMSVLKATVLGVPLPLCSCGVIPPATSLRMAGASMGATLAFLISTPTTGIDSILATYGLLGWFFMVFRIFASVLIALTAGGLGNVFLPSGTVQPEKCSACEITEKQGFSIKEVFRYGFSELYPVTEKWIFAGVILGGAISYLVPGHIVSEHLGGGWKTYLIMALAGIPLYVCATGSIPLVSSLIAKGMSVGAGFVFLVTGPATNMVTMLFAWKFLGKKGFAIYLFSVMAGALILGKTLDFIHSKYHFSVPVVMPVHHDHLFIIYLLAVFVLIGISLTGLIKKTLSRFIVFRKNRNKNRG